MKKFINILSLTLPGLTIVAIGCLLLLFESDFLWKLQETNLFLNSKIFFEEQMLEPGGFLSWIATWFTQFFFHPWLGVLMLCAWWLLLMWLVKKAFCVSRQWLPITVIPVLILLVTIVDTGYWVYILKLKGHPFLATIGTTVAVAILWAFRLLHSVSGTSVQRHLTLLRSAFVLLTCAIGYPLMGIYGIAPAAVMALWVWRLEPCRRSALAVSLTALASAWLVPLFFYRFVYYQTNIANIYAAKLPLYYVTEEYSSYYVPFIILLAFFLLLAVVKLHEKRAFLMSAVLFVAAAVYAGYFWYSDENFHHELAMQRCIDRLDWEGVLKEAATQECDPTRAIVLMRNLALAHLGRQGNEMYHYKNGCKRCDAPFDIRAINSVGPLIYYHYGMPNYSYRLCMERGVEFGWRAEQLKFMARCAIVNHELPLARKYLRLLGQTMFHHSWAQQMFEYTRNPENIAKMPEMDFISHLMHYDDKLTSDQNLVENFLMKRLMLSNYYKDPVFLEQVIFAAMAAKDASLFWPRLYNYTNLYPDRPWPIHVQEAVCLFSDLNGNAIPEKSRINPSVIQNYTRFDQIASQYEGADWAAANAALYPLFGNTYFYDYYLVNFPAQN